VAKEATPFARRQFQKTIKPSERLQRVLNALDDFEDSYSCLDSFEELEEATGNIQQAIEYLQTDGI
jgi:hypothetical protein